MAEHIKREEFVRRLAKKMETDEETAEAWLDATLEAMYQVFKSGKGISFAGFGGFYLDRRRESTAFKFNPGQKLRAKNRHLAQRKARQVKEISSWESTRNTDGQADRARTRPASEPENGGHR
jgi:nucleoid DNA-binding protein